MNYKSIILATILGISTPAIIDMAIPNQAIAVQRFDYPAGEFRDKDWTVSLSFSNNVYYYYGENRNNNSNINLSGAVASGNKQRQVYTWNNNGLKYQITWRPNDPNFIRVEVIRPNGRVILNRVLKAVSN
ncbi:hypothetical protein VB713_27950 [Anabaena cylindrica UHCC 0172]|uniref:hypothetical protein n=1 Tax=Anabaena cylindrica TaxID=1165 RepID=UPI002B1FE5E8|nr:hypothetical protein [Anabaena cylindrica]MEA5554764.1 hypothetical protein [Anabaena cylindrica UHCC 0172]